MHGRSASSRRRLHLEPLEDRSLLSLFGPPVAYPTGGDANALAAGDFDGDGRADLAAANSRGGSVGVLRNVSAGQFGNLADYPVAGQPTDVTTGDFNGDGRLDLAVISQAVPTSSVAEPSGGLSILFNQGNGTFAVPVFYRIGTAPFGLAAGDFNSDGNLDLAVTNFSGGGGLNVLLNLGNGTFAAPVSYTAGSSAIAVVAADLNGDGKLDLAVADGSSALFSSAQGAVNVLLNQGNGTFGPATSYAEDVSNGGYRALAAADFNGDGRPDLAVANGGITLGQSGNLLVLLNQGNGAFAAPVRYAPSIKADAETVGDFNGDGRPDLAAADFSSNNVLLLLNQGGGTFAAPLPVVAGANPTDVTTADFNGDGRPDLAAAIPTGSGLAVLANTGVLGATVGTFDPSTGNWYLRGEISSGPPDVAAFPFGGVGWQGVVGDWQGQGLDSVAVIDPTGQSNPTDNVWYIRFRNSAGPSDVVPFAYGARGWLAVAGDWNGDRVASPGVVDPATMTWYLRNSDSSGAPDLAFSFGAPGWVPVVGDWNGDGATSIGAFDPATGTWYLRNENSGGAPDAGAFSFGGAGWKPVTGDFDGNGTSTVGVVDPTGTWYLRNSNGAGSPDVTPFPYGLGSWTPVAGSWAVPAMPLRAEGSLGVLDATLAALGRRQGQDDGTGAARAPWRLMHLSNALVAAFV